MTLDLDPHQRAGVERLLEDAALREMCRRSLRWFVRHIWHVVEPRPLAWGPYLDIICGELEAVSRGETSEQVICMPPGLGKSTICSVIWPAWDLLRDPTLGILGVSSEESLAARDSRRCRDLVRSPEYRELVTHGYRAGLTPMWAIDRSQWDRTDWITDQGGYRFARGIGGRVTGRRARRIICDDVIDAAAVLDDPSVVGARMGAVSEYYDVVLASRLDEGGARVVVQQRLSAGDLAGVRMSAGARACVLPMRADPTRTDCHPLDTRAEGERLAPGVYSEAREAALRQALGSRHAAAQLDQRPGATDGSVFHRSWVRYLSGDPASWPWEERVVSVDATFKGGSGSDWVVCQVWSRDGSRFRLLDQLRARMDYRQTKEALVALLPKWPGITAVYIEEAANGPALISDLRDVLPGVVGVIPRASKRARAEMVAPAWESGSVEVPTPQYAPWVGGFVEEVVAFPGAPNDDQVDGMSQILGRWVRAAYNFGVA